MLSVKSWESHNMAFKIGSTLGGIQDLEVLFAPDRVYAPDWSFQPFATSITLANGTVKGQGFPVAIWRFNHLSNANRDELKDLCPNLSALVYIETATNEIDIYGGIVYKQFRAVMRWTAEDEDKVADETIGVVITFTHLTEQV